MLFGMIQSAQKELVFQYVAINKLIHTYMHTFSLSHTDNAKQEWWSDAHQTVLWYPE